MNNMTDILEQYIQSLFKESEENHIVIKRSNVAEKFDCVPSQLNYVIKTRFTREHGFFIESKRGGGGFIRITRITLHQEKDYIDYLIEKIDDFSSDLESTLKMLKILKDKNYINNFEYNHIEDSINSVIFLEQQFLQIATKEQMDIIKEKTKDSIKDLTIKFLTNIKYK